MSYFGSEIVYAPIRMDYNCHIDFYYENTEKRMELLKFSYFSILKCKFLCNINIFIKLKKEFVGPKKDEVKEKEKKKEKKPNGTLQWICH